MKVKVKKIHPNAVIPKYSREGDAGLDLVAVDKALTPEGKWIYDTGLAFEIPKGFVGQVFPRSGIFKKSQRLSNSVGIIDSNFRGSIKFIFDGGYLNRENYEVGDRIGQLIIMPYPQIELEESEELSETERGDQGFGSSGK